MPTTVTPKAAGRATSNVMIRNKRWLREGVHLLTIEEIVFFEKVVKEPVVLAGS